MTKVLTFLSRWISQSGDDTFWSWVITLMYIVILALSIYSVKNIKTQKPQRILWICITIFLTAMGINKQLDIQILVIMVGKFIARHLGLLEYRSAIYIIVALGLLLCMVAAGIFILSRTRMILRQSILAISGIAILMFFVLIRALPIHIAKIHALELLGLIFILVDRIIYIRNLKKNTLL